MKIKSHLGATKQQAKNLNKPNRKFAQKRLSFCGLEFVLRDFVIGTWT